MKPKMVAVGIDLAVQPANTGVCVLREDLDGLFADFDRSRRDDDGLARLIIDARSEDVPVAVDVPLGWPKRFVDFLQAPSSQEFAEDLEQVGTYRFTDLRLRAADRELRDHLVNKLERPDNWTGPIPSPLSVSTDKLGAATMRWHAIRAKVKSEAHSAGALDRVIETYPAAARYVWGWADRKSPPGDVGDLIREESRKINEHEWDALVASLVARLDEDAVERFPQHGAAEGEGIIRIPLSRAAPRSE